MKINRHLPKPQILAFVIIFAAVGTLLLLGSHAQSPAGTINVNLASANSADTCSTQLTSQDTYGYLDSVAPPSNGDPNAQQRIDSMNTVSPAVWRAMANGGYNTISSSEPSPATIYPAGQTTASANQTGQTDLNAWSFAALDKQLAIAPTNDARELTIPSPPDALFTGEEAYDTGSAYPDYAYVGPQPGALADPTYSQLADYMADLVTYYRAPMIVSSSGTDTNGGTQGQVTYGSKSLTDPNVNFATKLPNFTSGTYTVTATVNDGNGFRDWEQGVVTSISGTNNDTLNFSNGWSTANSYYTAAGYGNTLPANPSNGAAYNLDTTALPSAPNIATANNTANLGKGWNPVTNYSTGTISQSGTTITGSGTSFNANMTGGTIYYSDGTHDSITYSSATSLTTSSSKTVSAGSTYNIVYGGSQWNGLTSFASATPWPRPPAVGNVEYFEMFNEPEYTTFGDRQLPQVEPPALNNGDLSLTQVSSGGLAPGTYYYKLTGLDERNNESNAGSEASITVPNDGNHYKVTINWSQSPTINNLGEEPTAYRIYRGTTSGGEQGMVVVGRDSANNFATSWSWTDPGTITPSGSPPSSNNTQATEFLWMPGEYVDMWNVVAPAMKAIDSTIDFTGPTQGNDGEVIGPYTVPSALTSGPSDSSWKSDKDFIQAIETLPSAGGAAANVRPSAITFHNYGGYQGNNSTESQYWSDITNYLNNFNNSGNSGESDASSISSADAGLGTNTQVWVDETNLDSNYYSSQNLEAQTQLGSAWLADEFAETCKRDPQITQLNTWSIQNNEAWALFYGGYNGNTSPPSNCYPSNSCTNLVESEPNLEYWVMQEIDKYFPAGSEVVPVSGIPNGYDAFAVKPPGSTTVSVVVINTQQDTNSATGGTAGGGDGSGVPGDVDVQLNGGTPTDTKETVIDQTTPISTGPTTTDLGAQSSINLAMNGFSTIILSFDTGGTPAPTATITANPNSIVSGNSSSLTWSSTNATSCIASGAWSGTQATSNSAGFSISPTTLGNNTYGLTCTGPGGSSSLASATVMVTSAGSSCTPGSSTLPTTPMLAQTSVTTLTTTFSWNSSSPSPGCSIVGYNIFRNGTKIATVTNSTSYTDSGLTSGNTYSYTVSAYDSASTPNTSSLSNPLSITTIPGDINGEGIVDIVDLSILLGHYGTNYAPAELSHDSTVSLVDLSILLGHYGQ